MVIAGFYLAILIAAATYPLVSPLRDLWRPSEPSGTIADFVVWTLWLAVLLGTYARQPDGRLWKLIFLVMMLGSARSPSSPTPSCGAWPGWPNKSRWASLSSSW